MVMRQLYVPLNSPQGIAALFACGVCGAAVANRNDHDLWHEHLDRIRREQP